MFKVRVSTRRSNYRRGGLIFTAQTAHRLADGRLSIVLDQEKAEALGEAGLRQLATDPAVKVELVDGDGLTEAEREAAARAAAEAKAAERELERMAGERAKRDAAIVRSEAAARRKAAAKKAAAK